ncbi:hypothetical protein FDECE_18456 [Fusarium decemcellulare]|nr:hypothetical protein FDECE_18456 [Fusarium decemcellulare]
MVSSETVMGFEWTFLALAYVFVAGRIYVRLAMRNLKLYSADYWLIVGLISCQGLLICDTLTYKMNAMDDFTVSNTPLKKIRFATNYFFDLGIYFPKFSIVAFYYNLVPVTHPEMRILLHVLTGITVSFALITFFCDTFWCGPDPSINWTGDHESCTVFTSMVLMRLNWALNFISEVLNVIYPIPLLKGLKMHSRRKKIGLTIIFGLGIITIAVSIGRFVTMLYVSNDISIYIWATAEICISAIVVALTALRPLLRKITNMISTTVPSSDDPSGNRWERKSSWACNGDAGKSLNINKLHEVYRETLGETMDPLSAVGLAGTIVQFVSFAVKLIAVASDIHDSARGINDEVENIETVYGKLERFSVDLGTDLKIQPQVHDGFAAKLPGYHQQLCAIQELSKSCKNDCDRLLGIIKGLPVERGPKTPWKSFRVALKLVWKSDEISAIDKRLQRTQATLTLHLSDLSNKFHGETFTRYERLEDICRSNHLRQQGQLRDIRQMLDKLAANLNSQAPAVYESHDIASLEQQMSVLSIAMKYTDLQQRIIRSLGFNNRQVRHDKIPEAHIQTFRWTFEQGDKEEATGARLLHWLQDGSGVFWVSGKPGSGKSTLMKYVADNERTRRALKKWSDEKELIVASHYFWIEGIEMQRSRQGLL